MSASDAMAAALITSYEPRLITWLIVGALVGIYFFYRGFRLLQRKRLILNTPASRVRSAALGLVEINGLANGPFSIIAPITGRNCYYYRTMVWELENQGKNSKWVKKADESLHVPFYVEDYTGRVLVNPQGAELDLHCDFKDEFSHSLFSSTLEIPGNINTFLLSRGIYPERKIKIEEYCIKPKNSLFILGTLAQNPGVEICGLPVCTVQNQSGPLVEYGVSLSRIMPLFANVKPRTEALPAAPNLAEPPVRGQGVSATAVAAAPAPEKFDLHPPTVMMKGVNNSAFVISWRSQRAVVQSLGWKSGLMIWGGPALTLTCVYCIALQLGWL